MRRRQGGEALQQGGPISDVPGGVGGHQGGAAVPLLPGPGGGRCQKGCRRRQEGCSGMRGRGTWVEGTGGWDHSSPGMEV